MTGVGPHCPESDSAGTLVVLPDHNSNRYTPPLTFAAALILTGEDCVAAPPLENVRPAQGACEELETLNRQRYSTPAPEA